MQYKIVFVCMLNIKFIQFNNLFKVSYQSKVFNRIFISYSAEILQGKKRKSWQHVSVQQLAYFCYSTF